MSPTSRCKLVAKATGGGQHPSPAKIKTVLGRIFLFLAFASFAFANSASPLRGKLVQPEGKDPFIHTASSDVQLQADEDTWKVLRDERLKNADMELQGHESAPGKFSVDGTHTHPVFV